MIHVITAYTRKENLKFYLYHYEKENIIWHLLTYNTKILPDSRPWIQPFIHDEEIENISYDPYYRKLNRFIDNFKIIDDDYYCFISDDDWVEEGLFNKINKMNDDVIFVSMKRGLNPDTYLICGDKQHAGAIGIEQYFIKGKILKQIRFEDENGMADGILAEELMSNFKCRYEPNLFTFFDFLNPLNREEVWGESYEKLMSKY